MRGSEGDPEMNREALADHVLLSHFIIYVENHLQEPLPIKRLAEVLSTTPKHLSWVVNHQLDLPVPTYIRRRRIREAAKAVRSTDTPMRDIAHRFQFTHQHYFSTLFRREFDLSPTAYRRLFYGSSQGKDSM